MAEIKEIDGNEILEKMTMEIKTNKLFGFRLLALELLCRLMVLICKVNLTIEHDFDEEL